MKYSEHLVYEILEAYSEQFIQTLSDIFRNIKQIQPCSDILRDIKAC